MCARNCTLLKQMMPITFRSSFSIFPWGILSILLTVGSPVWALPVCLDAFDPRSGVHDELAAIPRLYEGLVKPLAAPQFRSPARLILTKFAGHTNFQSASTQQWTSNGTHFVAGQASFTKQVGHSENDSIFANQQDFSLGKMVETGYLTPEQARLFRKDALGRETGQVSFLEVVHDATPDEIKKYYVQFPQTRVGGTHTYDRQEGGPSDLRPIKTAALYSASGQIWSETGALKKLPLPWEKEESRKGQQLDRDGKYKYVWEWGRAGQDAAGEIAPLYAANALLNYVDLRAHGGKLDDAYVMVHSFDKVNTRLYSRMHPGTLYPKDSKDPNDSLFLVPLKDAIEKYRPSSISEPLAAMVRLSDGKLSDLEALDLLIDNRLWRWSELDYQNYRGVRQGSPIIMNDLSNARSGLLMLALAKAGVGRENAIKVTDYMLGISNLLHTANTNGKYNNAADSLLTSHQYLHRFNGVEISNLDPIMAKNDPFYAGSVLMSAFTQYVRNMAKAISERHQMPYDESYAHALRELTEGPVKFGITTHSPEIEAQIKKLGPSATSIQKATVRPARSGKLDADADELSRPYLYRDARIYIFTPYEIRKLITAHPDFYRVAGAGLFEGTWRAHYLLSQPDLF